MTRFADIDWSALSEAAYISVAVGLGVLLVAALAVTTSLRGQDTRARGNGSASAAYNAATVVCVLALVGAVVLGIYFMTDK